MSCFFSDFICKLDTKSKLGAAGATSDLCYFFFIRMWDGLPRRRSGKESAWQYRRHKRHRFDPWVRKNPWSRNWQPTPVFLESSMDRGAWWAVSMGSQRVGDDRTCIHTPSHSLRDVIVPLSGCKFWHFNHFNLENQVREEKSLLFSFLLPMFPSWIWKTKGI